MKTDFDHTTTAFSGALWMLSNLGGREVLAVVLNVVLMRILVPEDFAAVALVSSVVAILNIISQLGVSVALVQRSNIDSECQDSAFTLTIILFVSGAVIIFGISGPLAQYYENTLLVALLKIAALTFVIRGISSFYRSLLLRDLRFRAIAIAEVIGTLVYGCISIIVALFDYGAFSLLWGNLGSALTVLLVFIRLKHFVPKSFGTLSTMKSLLKFGAWISIGRILGQASGKFDRFLIGKVLTEQALGAYHQAQHLSTALPNLITGMLDQVMLPIYSSMKNDPQLIERGYWKGVRFSTLLVVPICILIGVYAYPTVWVLFGDKWLYMVPLMQIFVIFGALQGMGGGLFASVIYAVGLPQLNPVVNGFRVIVLPLCVWIGSRWGVVGVAWGIVIFGVAGRLFNQWLLTHYLKYSFLKFLMVISVPLLANFGLLLLSMLIVKYIPLDNELQTIIFLAMEGIVVLAVYILLCYLLMPTDIRFVCWQLGRLFKKKINSSAIESLR